MSTMLWDGERDHRADHAASVASSRCLVPFGPPLPCRSFLLGLKPTGKSSLSGACRAISTASDTRRIFTEKEVELARERMPSERKMHTGLFKWKDIKRWHTTWQAWLCKYPSATSATER